MKKSVSSATIALACAFILAVAVGILSSGMPAFHTPPSAEATTHEAAAPAQSAHNQRSYAEKLQATKDYVAEAVRRYREDPAAAIAYYRTGASVHAELGLYLLMLEDDIVVFNYAFPDAEGTSLFWRADARGEDYGRKIGDADEDGVVVKYLVPVASDDYTFRQKTAWAIKADGLVFSAGWIDREADAESDLTQEQQAVGAVIKARARLQAVGVERTVAHYNTPGSIDGEFYVWLAYSGGEIAAAATMPQLVGTNIRNLQASDDAKLGEKIAAADVAGREALWISHLWQNPESGREELKHTYVSRLGGIYEGIYFVSGYYDQTRRTTLTAHGIDAWHRAGFTGTGVKVGLIDYGFADFEDHPLTDDIDGQLCFQPPGPDFTNDDSGTDDLAVCKKANPHAPAAHGSVNVGALRSVAPDAEIYITNPAHWSHIPTAIDWLIAREVDVIVKTQGWIWEGAGDGKPYEGIHRLAKYGVTAPVYPAVDKATAAGILWMQGMGNEAGKTWTGPFHDPDGDGWLNFEGDDECNDVGLTPGPAWFFPFLRWDDHVGDASKIRDLDFYLLPRNGDVNLDDLTQMTDAEKDAFHASRVPDITERFGGPPLRVNQNVDPIPLEVSTLYPIVAPGPYCVAVNNVSETREERRPGPDWVQMQLWHAPSGQNSMEYTTPDLPTNPTPADSANPALLAIGSTSAGDSTKIAPDGGRGPTLDGRLKPDIVASLVEVGEREIEEAGAVAGGIAALVKGRYPHFTNVRIAEYLRTHAEDRGITGPDSDWGYGFAKLPAPCDNTIDDNAPTQGEWTSDCVSKNLTQDGDHYAQYFSFTLTEKADVTIKLKSGEDTYMFLLDGDKDGNKIAKNDDHATLIDTGDAAAESCADASGLADTDSCITKSALGPGDYTIEATTYDKETTGVFTLEVAMKRQLPPVKYKAIGSGAKHACAITTDGGIDCRGDDSHGQVSKRPASGSFTAISSGDDHTCALRDDGEWICWGSITVP